MFGTKYSLSSYWLYDEEKRAPNSRAVVLHLDEAPAPQGSKCLHQTAGIPGILEIAGSSPQSSFKPLSIHTIPSFVDKS